MAETVIPIIKGDTIGVETDYRDALMVNMYAVQREIMGAKGYILTYPGLTSFGTASGIDRGGVYNERQEAHYRVSGTDFVSVSTSGAVSVLGTVSGSEQVALPYSFNTQAIVAGGNYYLYDTTLGFRQVTDPHVGTPIDGVWVDNFYFFTDGEYIYHTELGDESSIDQLDEATSEFSPDPTLGLLLTQDNKVMVMNRYTTEYYVGDGSIEFAFIRVPTRAQKIGIVATHAKCESGGSVYITGGRREDAVGVHIIGIGSTQKVSTREIDKVIAQYTEPELSDMRMESRTDDNVSFILVHLPNETLCFNATIAGSFGVEQAWTILKTDVTGDNTYRGINGVFDARITEWIYGDKVDSRLGKIDADSAEHYGETVETLFFTPFIKFESASIDSIELETIPGHTTTDDATVAFSRTSNGLTYGLEYWLQYGTQNDYDQRFIKRRVGYVRDWSGFKFRAASKSRMAFSALRVTYG
ncbi:MAG: hypothetical protein GY746_10970 [Gammaproteobacteria bacterium]|nr:hypothetical protein [Gammaproteobacteria bacterium]